MFPSAQLDPQDAQEQRLKVVAAIRDMSDSTDDDDDDYSGTGPGSGSSSMSAADMAAMIASGHHRSGPGGSDSAQDMLIDYNKRFAGTVPAQHRDQVIERTVAALISKLKPNALLVGPAGVGKTRIVEEIARRITASDPSIPPSLRGKKVYELPLSSLISGASMMGEIEARVEAIIEFATDPKNKAVLFIDEIHQLVGSNSSSNKYDSVSQQLKPALARGDLHVIGATTTQESRQLADDPAFSRRFTTVGIAELSCAQTTQILGQAVPDLVEHYNEQILVDTTLLNETVAIADEYLRTLHRPDSALTLLDRTMGAASAQLNTMIAKGLLPKTHKQAINHAMLVQTAESMHGSDAGRHPYKINDLREALTEIIGQDSVCDAVVDQLQRSRLRLFPQTSPITWMFAGPSGVGKTRIAEIVAAITLGKKPLLLNMAEYAEAHSISSLIGSPMGYVGSTSNKEMPFDELAANPYQVIVLDEFEKAHRDVQRLFLGAFDRGTMRMASGKAVDFSKALVIATTNAGRDELGKGGLTLGFTTATIDKPVSRERITKAMRSHFEDELLGRIDWLVSFSVIDIEQYIDIMAQAYTDMLGEIASVNPVLAAVLPDEMPEQAARELAQATYVKVQGARTAAPAVRAWIEELAVSAAP